MQSFSNLPLHSVFEENHIAQESSYWRDASTPLHWLTHFRDLRHIEWKRFHPITEEDKSAVVTLVRSSDLARVSMPDQWRQLKSWSRLSELDCYFPSFENSLESRIYWLKYILNRSFKPVIRADIPRRIFRLFLDMACECSVSARVKRML